MNSTGTKKQILINPLLLNPIASSSKKGGTGGGGAERERGTRNTSAATSAKRLHQNILQHLRSRQVQDSKYNASNRTAAAAASTTSTMSSTLSRPQSEFSTALQSIHRPIMSQTMRRPNTVPLPLQTTPNVSPTLTPFQPSTTHINQQEPVITMSVPSRQQYAVDTAIPYGSLKTGGVKPSYRQWIQTTQRQQQQRQQPSHNDIATTSNSNIDNDEQTMLLSAGLVRPPTPPLESQHHQPPMQTQPISVEVQQQMSQLQLQLAQVRTELAKQQNLLNLKQQTSDIVRDTIIAPVLSPPPTAAIATNNNTQLFKTTKPPEKYRTIRQQFQVGRIGRKLHMVITDKNTRRRILHTEQELKKVNLAEVKRYLREHGLIRAGSLCSPSMLRQLYESSILAGNIYNTNSHLLLYNINKELSNDHT